MHLALWTRGDGSLEIDSTTLRSWRGELADPPPPRSAKLAGRLVTDTIRSVALEEDRVVTWYLPPERGEEPPAVVYLTDGSQVPGLALSIDTLVSMGRIPPLALVGIWSGERPPSADPFRGIIDDWRAVEYLEGVASAAPSLQDSVAAARRYAAHETFFVQEIPAWAERTLGVSTAPADRALYGVSNGGAFALTMGRKYADLYGGVIAFSHGPSSAVATPEVSWGALPPHFLAVGWLEPSFSTVLHALADSLSSAGVPVRMEDYPSGHDGHVWSELFPQAVEWWLTQASPLRGAERQAPRRRQFE